ncbi:hephaestin-like protein 1a isoform X2 [Chiloscyllium plagiosum]|uniref:hephaestin-like protein 1a isoform X2 n=1 Tax=Chiloscyllium plagiosum TaxID=36176 RepID=UPI001CB82232|nr:hephaestin-like protein 1a isoform X2 [Chiloscyllium plagiosum]
MSPRHILLVLSLSEIANSITRNYYIAVKEETWDYAPSGINVLTNQDLKRDENAAVFLSRSKNRIGRLYKKAIYKQFTDATYSTEVSKPDWLGFLGPLLRAEVEDLIIIHFKNFASRPYSLHPHGVFYKKDSEGAFYPDQTSGKYKVDDAVPPGGSHIYTWIVKKEYAPTDADPACLTWIYHSHVDAPKDISSGLIGVLLTCKKGILDDVTLKRKDVDQDFVMMFSVVDENLSWYLDDNINEYCTLPSAVDKDDEAFQESNKMHSINGFLFGNLPGLNMCRGQSISWHLFSIGNEVDIHSAYFHGQTLINKGHKVDVISLFPATFVTVQMISRNVGKWLLSCQVNDHIKAGMQALFVVQECGHHYSETTLTGKERNYFIAAEIDRWKYGPTNKNLFNGQPLDAEGSDSEIFFKNSTGKIGGEYWKVRYVEYTDETFSTRKNRSQVEDHLGILGPVIKAEVGDTIFVTFMNNADRAYSIQPHGVYFTKEFDGTSYVNGFEKNGSHVEPDTSFIYKWTVPDHVGPAVNDPPCLTWMYYSATNPVEDTNSGLIGPLVVCRQNTLNPDGSQKDIEQEFYLLYTVFDENLSWYLPKNLETFIQNSSSIDQEDEEFQESNKMHGTFKVICRTADHYMGGMKHMYHVRNCNKSVPDQVYETIRTYYIAAVELEWDYSPDRNWELERHNATKEESFGHVFVGTGQGKIGPRYKKVVYREFTDGTFTTQKIRLPEEQHLEILGPIIRAEVGDSIVVIFKNLASFPYSIHPHGAEEVNSGKHLKVPVTKPGQIKVYRWNVPERSGPGIGDSNCITWIYYSAVRFVKDLYSGLVGPLVTCRKGVLSENGMRKDVDREFALLFMVYDENESWYLDNNIITYLHVDPTKLKKTDEFVESNKIHAINGKIYGNLHGLTMVKGEKVDWYLLGMGNEVDMHTVHFHAQSFIYRMDNDYRADVYDLFPGTFQTIEMIASNPGTWLLHCHVADHIHAGMETTYTILNHTEYGRTTLESQFTMATTNDGSELKIHFLGNTLTKKEIKLMLALLLIIGVFLLLISLVFLCVIIYLHGRKSFRHITQSSIPMNSI